MLLVIICSFKYFVYFKTDFKYILYKMLTNFLLNQEISGKNQKYQIDSTLNNILIYYFYFKYPKTKQNIYVTAYYWNPK